MKHRKLRPSKQRDSYALSRIEDLLIKHIDGDIKLTNEQLKAMDLRYSRLRPTLSAVEHAQQDPRDAMQPGELVAKLAALFNDKPELWEQVRLLREQTSAANDEQTQRIAAMGEKA